MKNINTTTEIILPTASDQENMILAKILNILKNNFAAAYDKNKLHDYMCEHILAVIEVNTKLGIVSEDEFKSELKYLTTACSGND